MIEEFGREFMRRTCRKNLSPSPQSQGLPQPPLELPHSPTARLIDLPSPEHLVIPSVDLRKAIEERTSRRTYTEEALSLDELSFLLWVTQGVKSVTTRPSTLRTVPSAGARHAFETYLLVNRAANLEPGLYRYLATEHALILLEAGEQANQKITQACLNQEQVKTSAVTFVWAAVMERMTWRYVERGYRYIFLDAGHVCQNLYLAAEAIHCGVCGIAAYDDELLNQALGIDGETIAAVYAASLGKLC